jgi:hypothetical protein
MSMERDIFGSREYFALTYRTTETATWYESSFGGYSSLGPTVLV